MFEGCYTAEDIKIRYKQLALKYHPDKGGTKEQFQGLQREYEEAQYRVQRVPVLPELFKKGEKYMYYKKPVQYEGKDSHWYRFSQKVGADIKVDSQHINLIWKAYKSI